MMITNVAFVENAALQVFAFENLWCRSKDLN